MNLFIIGAAKAGTTSLYYYLEQHPDTISSIVKEPHYFSHINPEESVVFPHGGGRGDGSAVWICNEKEYLDLYPNARGKRRDNCFMDAAVTNLYSETAAQEIKKFDLEAKIIILLRNPIDRAWSHYNHLVRDGRETESFEMGLDLEVERIKNKWEFSWHYKQMGLYDQQIMRYFDNFPEDQICILLFEDFIKNTPKVLTKVTDFLELSEFEYQEIHSHNSSGRSRLPALAYIVDQVAGYKKSINRIIPPSVTHKTIQWFRKLNVKETDDKMQEETREYLIDYFRDSIQRTEELINRDLTHWIGYGDYC